MEQLSPQLMNRLVFAVIMHGLNDAQTQLALTVLTDALKHSNPQIRELAVVALSDLSVASIKRVPPLIMALRDESPKVRRRAARALGEQGPVAQSALSLLVEGLNDKDVSVRRDCAGAIGRLGPAASAAAGPLVKLLAEEDYRTRAVVAASLKRIGGEAINALLEGIRFDSEELRTRCAMILARIAPNDETVMAAVHDVLPPETTDPTWMIQTPAPVAI